MWALDISAEILSDFLSDIILTDWPVLWHCFWNQSDILPDIFCYYFLPLFFASFLATFVFLVFPSFLPPSLPSFLPSFLPSILALNFFLILGFVFWSSDFFWSLSRECVQEVWPISVCKVPLSYGGAKTISKFGFWWLDLQYTICSHYLIYVSLSCFQPWPEQLLEQYFNLHLMPHIPNHRWLKHAEWETPQMETCQSRTGLIGAYVVRWSLLYLFTWFLEHINTYHAIIRCEIHGEFSSRNSVSWITSSRLHIWRSWKRFVSIDELCVQEVWPISFCKVPLSYGGA